MLPKIQNTFFLFIFLCAARLHHLNHRNIWLKVNALKVLVLLKRAVFLLMCFVKVSPLCVWIVDAGRESATKRIADRLQLDSR